MARASILPRCTEAQAPRTKMLPEGAPRLVRVELSIGSIMFRARLDSGGDLVVIRASVLPQEKGTQGKSQVRLEGASGHTVSAELTELPLGLKRRIGRRTKKCSCYAPKQRNWLIVWTRY